MYAMALSSEIDAEETLPASRVVSSQIPDYDGGEVDTNETVEIIFPLIVRNYVSCLFIEGNTIPFLCHMQQSYGCNMYLNELKLLLYPACTLHRYYIRVMLHVFSNVNLLSFIILAGEGNESYSSSWEKEGVSLCLLQLHWRGQQDWRMVLQRGEDSRHQ